MLRFAQVLRAVSLLFVLSTASGCLSSQYTVSHAELTRLASLPPEARTEINATQQMQVFGAPDRSGYAPQYEDRTTVGVGVGFSRSRTYGGGTYTGRGTGGGGSGVTVITSQSGAGQTGGGGLNGGGRGAANPTVGGAEGGRSAAQPSVNGEPQAGGGSGRVGSNAGSSGGTGSSGGSVPKVGSLGKEAAIMAVVVIAAAVFVGVAVAASEAERFEGSMAVSPEHPVYLRDEAGNPVGWMPLYALDPSNIPPGGDGIIADDVNEGALTRLRRAALNRKGASYMLELGAGALNRADRAVGLAPAARIGIGYFPIQQFGLYAGVHLTLGDKAGGTAVDTRPFVEAQFIPLNAGILHLGAYGEVGYSLGSDITAGRQIDVNGLGIGGGVLGQLDVSTFLALTARAGIIGLGGPNRTVYSPTLSLGIAVF